MAWSLIAQGVNKVREGKPQEGLAPLEKAAHDMPGEPRAFLQLGLAQIEDDQNELALETLDRALQLAPGHPAALLYSALASLELDRQDAVDDWLSQLRKVRPDNQILPSFEALIWLRRGHADKASATLELPPGKQSPPWRRPEILPAGPFIGRLLAAVERWLLPLEVPRLAPGQALTDAPVIIDAGPGGAQVMEQFRAWYSQNRGMRALEQSFGGDSAHRRQRLELSIERLRAANDQYTRLFRGRYNLGEALLYCAMAARGSQQLEPPLDEPTIESRLAEATDCFEASWALDGPNPYLFYYLARCAFLSGQLEASVDYYERAMKLFAKLSEAHYGLGQCAVLRERSSEARYWLCRAAMCDLQSARERLFELGYRVANGELSSLPPLPELILPAPSPPPDVVAPIVVAGVLGTEDDEDSIHTAADPEGSSVEQPAT